MFKQFQGKCNNYYYNGNLKKLFYIVEYKN